MDSDWATAILLPNKRIKSEPVETPWPTTTPPSRQAMELSPSAKTEWGVCGICFAEEGKVARGRIDGCDHFFCSACIVGWAEFHSQCPLCQLPFSSIRIAPKDVAFGSDLVLQVPARELLFHESTRDQTLESDSVLAPPTNTHPKSEPLEIPWPTESKTLEIPRTIKSEPLEMPWPTTPSLQSEGKQKLQVEQSVSSVKLETRICGICFAEEENVVRGRIDSCDHFFCSPCIVEWAEFDSQCPLCKCTFSSICLEPEDSVPGPNQIIQVPAREALCTCSDSNTCDLVAAPFHGSGETPSQCTSCRRFTVPASFKINREWRGFKRAGKMGSPNSMQQTSGGTDNAHEASMNISEEEEEEEEGNAPRRQIKTNSLKTKGPGAIGSKKRNHDFPATIAKNYRSKKSKHQENGTAKEGNCQLNENSSTGGPKNGENILHEPASNVVDEQPVTLSSASVPSSEEASELQGPSLEKQYCDKCKLRKVDDAKSEIQSHVKFNSKDLSREKPLAANPKGSSQFQASKLQALDVSTQDRTMDSDSACCPLPNKHLKSETLEMPWPTRAFYSSSDSDTSRSLDTCCSDFGFDVATSCSDSDCNGQNSIRNVSMDQNPSAETTVSIFDIVKEPNGPNSIHMNQSRSPVKIENSFMQCGRNTSTDGAGKIIEPDAGILHRCRNEQSYIRALRENWNALQSRSLSFPARPHGWCFAKSFGKKHAVGALPSHRLGQMSSTSFSSQHLTAQDGVPTRFSNNKGSGEVNRAWKMMDIAKRMQPHGRIANAREALKKKKSKAGNAPRRVRT